MQIKLHVVARSVVVEAGDTLSAIALTVFGRASAWRDIARKNRLVNPHMIVPGQELRL